MPTTPDADLITERDLEASTARDDHSNSPSKYVNAEAMARRYIRLTGRLTAARAMDPAMAVVQGSRSSDGLHNQMCERADIRSLLVVVKAKVTKRRWKSWVYYRLIERPYREIPGVTESTARRDVARVDIVVDDELEIRDMLGDWR